MIEGADGPTPAVALPENLQAGTKRQRLHRLRSHPKRDRRMGERDRQPPTGNRPAIFGPHGKRRFPSGLNFKSPSAPKALYCQKLKAALGALVLGDLSDLSSMQDMPSGACCLTLSVFQRCFIRA